jgi:Ca-activated chloride channel family protein
MSRLSPLSRPDHGSRTAITVRQARTLLIGSALLAAGLALLPPQAALADGIIIPDPPLCDFRPCPEPIPFRQLAIEYHRVTVTIEDQVAITHVDQRFRNDNDWVVEGTYVFPLPSGAAVTGFTLWVDDEPVEGEVLSREEARRIYEDIVRSLRDPALLEYVDRGAVQASVFPIQPGESRRIELEYSQVLPLDAGLVHYNYPLNTEKFSTQPLEVVSLSVHVRSNDPLRAIYSPTHRLDVSREGDFEFRAGYEARDLRPDKDFDLYYSVADGIGVNLLTFGDPESDDPDGFFLLLAAPGFSSDPGSQIPKDLIFVLDQSGSMEGEKFRQAQQAVRYVLEHLNPADRFNILAFSTGLRPYSSGLRPAEEAAEAARWVDSLAAMGSTDINRALLEAVAQSDRERPTFLLFLTDGLPTEGETEAEAILANLQQAAPRSLSLFAFGVGYDVDTFLLDTLAQEHHGASTYVAPEQPIDEAVSGFYAKISTPVLTDLQLDFGDLTVYDLQPDPLPDLFAGGQLVLLGRYRQSGTGTVTLSGSVQGRIRTFEYPKQEFRRTGGPDFLPRLWATRKIGALLSQIRLQGPEPELVDQVVKLSIRYGIVTPYTSYLVTEPSALSAEAQDEIAERAYSQLLATPTMTTGQAAVERAAGEGEIQQADIAAAPPADVGDILRVVGSRSFRLTDGVWVDTAVDLDGADPLRIPFLSTQYFELAQADPELGAAFALGERVMVSWGGLLYEVVGAEEAGDPLILPAGPEDEVSRPDEPGEEPLLQPRRGGTQISLPCLAALPLAAMALLPRLHKKRSR